MNYNLLVYLSIISVLVPLIGLIVNYKQLKIELKTLLLVLALSFVSDLVSTILSHYCINTHFIFHIYTFLESVLLCTYFYRIYKSKWEKGVVWIFGIILISVSIYNAFFGKGLNSVNNIASIVEGIVLSILSFLYYFNLLNKIESEEGFEYSGFWINTAIFIYGTIPLFCFLFYNSIGNNRLLTETVWTIFLFSNIAYHLLLSLGIWKYKTQIH